MHLSKNDKIKSLINNFPENMIHFIFLLNTSHLNKQHKICFTIFGSQKQEIWFLQESQKSGFWIKEKEAKRESLTGGPTRQALLPRGRGDLRRRFLHDGEVSGQTQGINVIPKP